jgi:hypothetical protein
MKIVQEAKNFFYNCQCKSLLHSFLAHCYENFKGREFFEIANINHRCVASLL